MRTWHCLLLVCGACGTNPSSGGGGGDDVVDPPVTMSALERCVNDGGALTELWSAGNQHGPVTSIVAGALVVLGSQDGSVKQWTVDGDEPSYGLPFTRAGSPVAAMALSADHILAATQQGEVAEWKLADASPARTTTIADSELSALAVSTDAIRAVTGTTTGQSVVIERATGVTTPLESTLWGVNAISFVAGNQLFTAGHWYGTPQIERRAADAPIAVVDEWSDRQRQAHVRAIATDADATRLVAAGDGFVASFAPDQLAAGPLAITELAEHRAVGALVLPGGVLVVTAGSEGTLRVWNAQTAALVTTLPIAAPIGIAADTAGTRLYTSGADGRLHAYGCK